MDPKYIQRFHEINEPGCPRGESDPGVVAIGSKEKLEEF